VNIFKLSFSSLRFHGLNNIFNVLILALGIATIVMLLHVSEQVEQRFERDLTGIDLVVGAKGSPIQLILSSVFHLGAPNGNIPLKEAEKLEKNPLIKSAIPVALGDSYRGFRIVGTTSEYVDHYEAQLADGKMFEHDMQAVLGSEVAQASRLQVGQSFAGTHGLSEGGEEHAQFPYEVVGILKPTGTVIDRLVITGVGSVWNVHEHHDENEHEEHGHEHEHHHEKQGEREITALLIAYKSPLAAATLPRMVNKTSLMQSASPAVETAQLIKILGVGGDTIRLFGWVLMGIAAIGFFVALFSAVSDRGYDIALMRALGATRLKIFAFVLTEGVTLGALGTFVGILLGHGFAYIAAHWIEKTRHMLLTPIGMHPLEPTIALSALGLSVVVAIIPAIVGYQTNVAKILSRGV
jgi:putative ABC transport system permease protein